MTDQELQDTLTGAFARSAQTGKPSNLMLERGLLGKAQQKPDGSRGLLVWRESDQLPSGATLDRLSMACGFLKAKYTEQAAGQFIGLLLTDAADYSVTCEHAWAPVEVTEKGQTQTQTSICQRCRVCLTVTTRTIKGKPSVKRRYDGHLITDMKMLSLTRLGPVPEDMPEAERSVFAAPQPQQVTEDLAPWEKQQQRESPQPRPVQRGQVCGTCKHGTLTEFNEVECQLGWAEHDPLFYVEYQEKDQHGNPLFEEREVWHPAPAKSNAKRGLGQGQSTEEPEGHWLKVRKPKTKWVRDSQVQLAHGGLELPLLSPSCRCMCRDGNRWAPRKRGAD